MKGNAMNGGGYLVSVVSAAALGVLADLVTVSYGKSGKGIEKYVRLAVSLCILGCILVPAIKDVDYEELFNKAQLEAQSAYAAKPNDSLYILCVECEEKASEYIFSKTGIKPANVSIEMELQENSTEPYVKGARVTISKEQAQLSESILFAAAEALRTEVEIVYEE